MTSKKTANLSSGLVSVKGQAKPASDSATKKTETPANEPLNFKVSPEFRQRFRQRALDANLKLNELLREALDAWEEKHGISRSKR